MIGSIFVDLNAMRDNARALAATIAPSAAAFVVKANAYGHGIVDVAHAIAPQSRAICVFSIDEALTLRAAGIAQTIIVLGPIAPPDLHSAIEHHVEFALWDTSAFMRDAARSAAKLTRRARVHLKVNSGLNRLGIEPESAGDAAADAAAYDDIEIAGIFSHLASAEEIDSPYTAYQLQRFQTAVTAATPAFRTSDARPLQHIAASAAAMLWPQMRLDMARIGIALYGLWPSAQTMQALDGRAVQLRPALSYRSRLVVVRDVPAGAAIGYGLTFHAPRPVRAGVVPLGYADGIPRLLSNRGSFVVDGVRVPIVGRIAMNMAVVDITAAPAARVGSEVTLIGTDGEATVSADDWALWAETINYEIVTRLPAHIPRFYKT